MYCVWDFVEVLLIEHIQIAIDNLIDSYRIANQIFSLNYFR